jgi:hypothetical protein
MNKRRMSQDKNLRCLYRVYIVLPTRKVPYYFTTFLLLLYHYCLYVVRACYQHMSHVSYTCESCLLHVRVMSLTHASHVSYTCESCLLHMRFMSLICLYQHLKNITTHQLHVSYTHESCLLHMRVMSLTHASHVSYTPESCLLPTHEEHHNTPTAHIQTPVQTQKHQYKHRNTSTNTETPVQTQKHQYKHINTSTNTETPVQTQKHQYTHINTIADKFFLQDMRTHHQVCRVFDVRAWNESEVQILKSQRAMNFDSYIRDMTHTRHDSYKRHDS